METDLTQPLREIFRASAEVYRKQYPDLLKHLIVTTKSQFAYVSPATQWVLMEEDSEKEVFQMLQEEMEDSGFPAYASQWDLEDSNNTVAKVVSIDLSGHFNQCITGRKANTLTKIYVFDHEMGHFIVRKGIPDFYNEEQQHIRECAADAFSALMHVKRFGNNTDISQTGAVMRTQDIMFHGSEHYTSPVFAAVGELQKRIDITKLSMPDIEGLASRVALRYCFSNKALEKIKNAYTKVRRMYKQGAYPAHHPKLCKEVARVMLAYKDNEDVYRAGRLFLSDEKRSRIVSREEPFWRKVRKEMQEHESRTEFILNPALAMDVNRRAMPVSKKHQIQ